MIACVTLDVDLAITNYNKGDIGMTILSIMAGILCAFVAGSNIHDFIHEIKKKNQDPS